LIVHELRNEACEEKIKLKEDSENPFKVVESRVVESKLCEENEFEELDELEDPRKEMKDDSRKSISVELKEIESEETKLSDSKKEEIRDPTSELKVYELKDLEDNELTAANEDRSNWCPEEVELDEERSDEEEVEKCDREFTSDNSNLPGLVVSVESSSLIANTMVKEVQDDTVEMDISDDITSQSFTCSTASDLSLVNEIIPQNKRQICLKVSEIIDQEKR